MKKTALLLFFAAMVVVFIAPGSAHTQSAKEAMLALKKMHARCQAGITYKEYGPALGEAKFSVNLFMEGEDAKRNSPLTTAINKAMSDYEMAGSLWRHKIVSSPRAIQLPRNEADPWLKLYPEAEKPEKEGGALNAGYGKSIGMDYFFYSPFISLIWKSASQNISQADLLLANSQDEQNSELTLLKKENERLKRELNALKKSCGRK